MATKNQFTAVFRKTKGWFLGWIEEIPGANTQGKSLAEVRSNLKEALLMVLESNKLSSRSNIGGARTSTRKELFSIEVPA